jgi:hypothetical protein
MEKKKRTKVVNHRSVPRRIWDALRPWVAGPLIALLICGVYLLIHNGNERRKQKEYAEVISSAYNRGYEEGYEEGVASGHQVGSRSAFFNGFYAGYYVGYDDAVAGREQDQEQAEPYYDDYINK